MTIIVVLAVAIVSVALFIEIYKKLIRGYKNEAGEIKTKASKIEIVLVAFALCLLWGLALWSLSKGNIFMLIVWVLFLFEAQYLVDINIVKKVFTGLLNKLGG